MRNRSRLPVAAAALAVALCAAPALAQDTDPRSQARELGKKGQDAFDAKNYKESEDDFRHADTLFHAPTLVLGLARALSAEGKVVEAWESYHRIILEAVTTTPPFARALDEAKTEITSVEGRRARVTISVAGSDQAHVTLDDAPIKNEALGVERFANPGPHTVKVTAVGFKDVSRDFTLAEGGAQPVPITLEPATGSGVAETGTSPGSTAHPGAPEPGGKRSLMPALIGFGVGGAGLVLGAVTGGLALGKHSTLQKECTGSVCPSSASSDLSSYHTMGTLSTVGFIVGGVGVAAGAVLLFVGPKSHEAQSPPAAWITPYVGPGSVGAVGRF
jgi:hypothetical protein